MRAGMPYAFVLIIKRFYLGFIHVFGVMDIMRIQCKTHCTGLKETEYSISYYLTALALFNNVIFLVVVFIFWLKHFDLDLELVSIRVCQTLFFISSLPVTV